MPIEGKLVTPMVVGAGLGAVLRSIIASSWTGMASMVAVGLMTAAGGLLAGLTLAVRRGRASALAIGLAAGTASSGLYAVWGVTAALRIGIVFMIAVPIFTAVSFTLGVTLVGVLRHRRRIDAVR